LPLASKLILLAWFILAFAENNQHQV